MESKIVITFCTIEGAGLHSAVAFDNLDASVGDVISVLEAAKIHVLGKFHLAVGIAKNTEESIAQALSTTLKEIYV